MWSERGRPPASVAVCLTLWIGVTGCISAPRPGPQPPRPAFYELIVADGNTLRFVDPVARALRDPITRYQELGRLAFRRDGDRLALAVCSGPNRIVELAPPDYNEVRVAMTGDGCPWDLAYSPDGESLAATLPTRRGDPLGAMYAKLEVVGSRPASLGYEELGSRVLPALAYHPGGRLLAVATHDAIKLLEIERGYRVVETVPLGMTEVRSLAFTGDGSRLIAGTDRGLSVFEAQGEFQPLSSLEGEEVRRVAVDPAGVWVAVVWRTGTTLHRAADLVQVASFPGDTPSLAAFSPDGTKLAIADRAAPVVSVIELADLSTVAVVAARSPWVQAIYRPGKPPDVATERPRLSGCGTAMIDGVMGPGEWASAGKASFLVKLPAGSGPGPGLADATLFAMNDWENLYLAVEIAAAAPNGSSLYMEFDNDNDGNLDENGNDVLILHQRGSLIDQYRTREPPCDKGGVVCNVLDVRDGGTSDGSGAYGSDGISSLFELAHPLDSIDDRHDFSLRPRRAVGVRLSVSLPDSGASAATTTFVPFAVQTGRKQYFAVARFLPDGSLDPSFSGQGTAITDLRSQCSEAPFWGSARGFSDLAAQVSGELSALGRYEALDGEGVALVRYRGDGKVAEVARLEGGQGALAFAKAMEIDRQGRAVIAGRTMGPGTADSRLAVSRFIWGIGLDPEFGDGGTVVTELPFGGSGWGRDLAIDGRDRIVAIGGTSDRRVALVRFQEDGSLDPSFGGDGVLISSLRSPPDLFFGGVWPAAVAIDTKGRILVAGTRRFTHPEFEENFNLVIARFLDDGRLDLTFGDRGSVIAVMPGANTTRANDLVIDAMGRVVALGTVEMTSGASKVMLLRLDAQGTLDVSFGDGGRLLTSFGGPSGASDWGRALGIDADGRLLVAGSLWPWSQFALARYTADGGRDHSFGENGVVTIDFDPAAGYLNSQEAFALAFDSEGRILVAGGVGAVHYY